jgi:hypothetical protein
MWLFRILIRLALTGTPRTSWYIKVNFAGSSESSLRRMFGRAPASGGQQLAKIDDLRKKLTANYFRVNAIDVNQYRPD